MVLFQLFQSTRVPPAARSSSGNLTQAPAFARSKTRESVPPRDNDAAAGACSRKRLLGSLPRKEFMPP